MEQDSNSSQLYKLESQIREAYGRVLYTQTTHVKKASRLKKLDDKIKISQIILSAIITSGFIATIIYNNEIMSIIGAIISLSLLILNSYMKNFKLSELAQDHIIATDILWKIREEYISLLTDFNYLSLEEILLKRDELQSRTHQVYLNAPKTDYKSYSDAQKSLKNEEEQTFSDEELDLLLPKALRRNNNKNMD